MYVIIVFLTVSILYMYATGFMGGIPKLLKLVEHEDFDTLEFDCKKHKVAYEALLEHEEGDDSKIDLLFEHVYTAYTLKEVQAKLTAVLQKCPAVPNSSATTPAATTSRQTTPAATTSRQTTPAATTSRQTTPAATTSRQTTPAATTSMQTHFPTTPAINFDPIDFIYNGSEQTWTSPGDGTILVWLQGGTGGNYGSNYGGEGGYIAVEIDVQKDVAYKIRVAGPGVNAASRHGGGGGGASGVFDPTTNTWMVIAGGGGGGADRGSGGAGGVPTIWNGTNGGGPNVASYGKLGTTTSVGLGGTGRRSALAGALHDGGKGGTEGTGPYAGGYGVGSGGLGGKGGNDYAGGGGGGGWFGGGGGGIASDGHGAGGGGGSSYYDGTNTNVALSSTQSATKYLSSINGFVRISFATTWRQTTPAATAAAPILKKTPPILRAFVW